MSAKLYAERDSELLGEGYVKHVMAMTAEGLHAKSDIAAELAIRDAYAEQLEAERDRLAADCTVMREALEKVAILDMGRLLPRDGSEVDFTKGAAEEQDRAQQYVRDIVYPILETDHPGDKLLARVAILEGALKSLKEEYQPVADGDRADFNDQSRREARELVQTIDAALDNPTGAKNAQVQTGGEGGIEGNHLKNSNSSNEGEG